MAIKFYKPTTPSRRRSSVLKHEAQGVQKRARSLVEHVKYSAGRGSSGRITVRHKGGRAARAYRIVDFSNPKEDSKAKVIGIQYDPNRTADVALVKYADNSIAYTLAVCNLNVGDVVETSRKRALEIKNGNRMALKYIPAGVMICNIELAPGKKASVVRSAGTSATAISSEEGFVQVKMPSGEIRKFDDRCLATVGQVGNPQWNLVRLGKAGRKRHMGVRPRVRGKAMNAVDHPHGGGEGRSPIGLKMPKTPWGKPALGVPTRRRGKASDNLIIRRRKKK